MERLQRRLRPHPPVAPQRAPPSPNPWARGYSHRSPASPSPALLAGEGATHGDSHGRVRGSVRHRGFGTVDVEGEILVVELLVGAVGADFLDRGVECILELRVL